MASQTSAKTSMERIRAFNEQRESGSSTTIKNDPTQEGTNTRVSSTKETIADKAAQTQEEKDAERDAQLKAERQRQQEVISQITDATANLVDRTQKTVNPVRDWIASQPTPGGIALLLIFIAFMAMAAIPVNAQGQTRLYLLWQSLLGRTHMRYTEGGSASGTFGNGSPTTSSSVSTANGYAGEGYRPQTNTGTQNGNVAPVIDLTHLNLFGN